MDTAFIIGNGESRNIFPIEELKNKGVIYGCNAIFRDYPDLCDHIIAVNDPMYNELSEWYSKTKPNLKIHGPDDISKWNYICNGDKESDVPIGLKLYRIWRGGDFKKANVIRTIDFTKSRGTGCSAMLMAAESGIKNVIIPLENKKYLAEVHPEVENLHIGLRERRPSRSRAQTITDLRQELGIS